MFLFFGIDLDPDERQESVKKKINYVKFFFLEGDKGFSDPYDALIYHLKDEFSKKKMHKLDKIPVEYWLVSKPKLADLISVANYVAFVDSNGCWEYSVKVRNFVRENILPNIPVMIGVDHSSSGGSIDALSKEFGIENLSVIVLDSHFDAILPKIRCGLVQYDLETNPKTKFRHFDPYIWERPDSYNADSFIRYLMENRIVYPENLVCIGVSDYPPPQARTIQDERVQNFVNSFLSLERLGTKIITKEFINRKGIIKSLSNVLMTFKTPYVYVSLDIDIGALSAHQGSRYLNLSGLSENQIYLIGRCLNHSLSKKGVKILGLDVMETDVHKAGMTSKNGIKDKTYEIEKGFLKLLLGAR